MASPISNKFNPSPVKSNSGSSGSGIFAQKTTSPTNNDFQPRPEFVRSSSTQHTFALVAINGTDILRLSNFPDQVINDFRITLDQEQDLKHFREDEELHVGEFVLGTKPFQNKVVKSEQFLITIFSKLLSHNYQFVSQIDYGRLYLDKVTLAFSTPHPAPQIPAPARCAFGISFLSQTRLRVLSPPLASTPAILASVRAAWPRGVAKEKRDDDGCYTFKLKGYSLFSENTFDRDSLAHILALLKTLDSHSFSLITSLSVTPRSRTKDLWIFSAPAQPISGGSVNGSVVRGVEGSGHIRAASSPTKIPIPQSPLAVDHSRAATEPPQRRQSMTLKKSPPQKVHPLPIVPPSPPLSPPPFPARQQARTPSPIKNPNTAANKETLFAPGEIIYTATPPARQEKPKDMSIIPGPPPPSSYNPPREEPLLSGSAFRDTAFSGSSEEEGYAKSQTFSAPSEDMSHSHSHSHEHEERLGDSAAVALSPVLSDGMRRKSEAGIVGSHEGLRKPDEEDMRNFPGALPDDDGKTPTAEAKNPLPPIAIADGKTPTSEVELTPPGTPMNLTNERGESRYITTPDLEDETAWTVGGPDVAKMKPKRRDTAESKVMPGGLKRGDSGTGGAGGRGWFASLRKKPAPNATATASTPTAEAPIAEGEKSDDLVPGIFPVANGKTEETDEPKPLPSVSAPVRPPLQKRTSTDSTSDSQLPTPPPSRLILPSTEPKVSTPGTPGTTTSSVKAVAKEGMIARWKRRGGSKSGNALPTKDNRVEVE